MGQTLSGKITRGKKGLNHNTPKTGKVGKRFYCHARAESIVHVEACAIRQDCRFVVQGANVRQHTWSAFHRMLSTVQKRGLVTQVTSWLSRRVKERTSTGISLPSHMLKVAGVIFCKTGDQSWPPEFASRASTLTGARGITGNNPKLHRSTTGKRTVKHGKSLRGT